MGDSDGEEVGDGKERDEGHLFLTVGSVSNRHSHDRFVSHLSLCKTRDGKVYTWAYSTATNTTTPISETRRPNINSRKTAADLPCTTLNSHRFVTTHRYVPSYRK